MARNITWRERNYLNSLAPDYCPPAVHIFCECGHLDGDHDFAGPMGSTKCEKLGCECPKYVFKEAKSHAASDEKR